MSLYERQAKKIPFSLRKEIIDGKLIDIAINVKTNKALERLFDIYEEFIDNGSNDNWSCFKCRETVLYAMKRLKPHIESLTNRQLLDAL